MSKRLLVIGAAKDTSKGHLVIRDAEYKLGKLITLLEEDSQNPFSIDRDESMNQSLSEAINYSLTILGRCFRDRRVIPVGNPDDEGR